MLQETWGRHGNLYIERCTESLVFLFQRNKEIFFQEEKRELKPEFRQRYEPKEEGNSGEEISSYTNFQEQMDIFLKMKKNRNLRNRKYFLWDKPSV